MGWNSDGNGIWSKQELEDPHRAADKARKVQAMFNAIAYRYDLANTVISFGQAGRWRRCLADMAAKTADIHTILDLCCGTGAMMDVLSRRFPRAGIFGVDFAVEMLRASGQRHPCAAADALHLPFPDGRFDLLSCVFGLRNLESLECGLREIHRVLRPGGTVAVLEFQTPKSGVLRPFFNAYFQHVLPVIGSLSTFSFRLGAYEYLPRSVKSWYDGDFLIKLFQTTGFARVCVRKLCLGAVWAVTAVK